ncbi:hypothetical protein KSB_88470 [Ktedonobacter robiniae]|uniref:Uncharacterized protein n=1 Tax=Ktedonobacter robiniae TaxID=2778365 RepID=A0ABQ3V763_9CHLR|nr:hypothetical protein KSB_88470 [Ktedonobacter robiniae]
MGRAQQAGTGHLFHRADQRGDINRQEEAKRIHENVAFASFHPFVRIKPADASRFLDGFHTLRIDDRRTRLGVPPNSLAFGFSQDREEAKPRAFEA